jgi:predicted transcriptional regulator
VLARIIKTLRDKGPASRTPLATACGLSYDRFVIYLDWIKAKGFVSVDGDGLVRLTPAGAKAYDELVQWILDHVGSLRLSKPPGRD